MGEITDYNYYCEGCGDFKRELVSFNILKLNDLEVEQRFYCPKCLFPLEKVKKNKKRKEQTALKEEFAWFSLDNREDIGLQ